jgi:alpha-L-fucosidase
MTKEDYEPIYKTFNPKPTWARELAAAAKDAGCRYITLTSRHHDGYSLYDTCGLSDFDAPHSCGRDLIREFVDACREEEIIPFFYHTLLDWHEETFLTDFPAYLQYLRDSVKLLCTNYGPIGGLWFDGTWSKPGEDWEEDALYGLIRQYQPEAIIVNNTGMEERGTLGNIELDSVTFERGKPQPINLEDSPRYIASEMCEVLNNHWGYADLDLGYLSTADVIGNLADCRRYRANFLLNVGPMPDGGLRLIDRGILEILGKWVRLNEEAIRQPAPTGISVEDREDDFILRKDNTLYLFVRKPSLCNTTELRPERFPLAETVTSACWLDSSEELSFTQEDGTVTVFTTPHRYGFNLCTRVVKLTLA